MDKLTTATKFQHD